MDSDEESSNKSIEVQETIQSSSILSPNTIRKNKNSNLIKRNHNIVQVWIQTRKKHL
jgi:hypothetical protein